MKVLELTRLFPRAWRRINVRASVFALTLFCARFACASEAEDATLDPLAWRGDLAIWTAVVFLLLVAILAKFAFGPILKALDQRERNELARHAAAEKANADAKELLDQYRRKLADSEEEVKRIISDAKAEASEQATRVVEEARRAAAEERERAVVDIQTATDAALRELAVKGARMATDLAGKLIQERVELDPGKGAQLVEVALNEIAEQ